MIRVCTLLKGRTRYGHEKIYGGEFGNEEKYKVQKQTQKDVRWYRKGRLEDQMLNTPLFKHGINNCLEQSATGCRFYHVTENLLSRQL
jgi:hypothetical protein